MQLKIENSESFSWKKIDEIVQLAFQEHPHANTITQDTQIKIHDNQNFKKVQSQEAICQPQIYVYHQEGSKQIYQGNSVDHNQNKLNVKLGGTFNLDIANRIFLTLEKSTLPNIIVEVNPAEIKYFQQTNSSRQARLVVQVLFAQKSNSSDKQKYKIFKSGITGCTRKVVHKSQRLQFKNLKINHPSSLDKNSRIMILLYHFAQGRKKCLREVMLSRDLFVIEQNKSIIIDSNQAIHQYFQLFGPQFMDTYPTMKLNRQDKHAFHEQINNIQKYLIKKNKKFLNIVYLSFKFPHLCQLHFKMPQIQNQEQYHYDHFYRKKMQLSKILLQALNQIDNIKSDDGKSQLLCNYINPFTKLIFRINANLRRVRIFLKSQYTQILSILVSQDAQIPQDFEHFSNSKELKEFYLEFFNFAKKNKNNESMNRHSSSGFLNGAQALLNKKRRGQDDDQYQKEQQEYLSDQEQSLENVGSKDKEVDSGQKKSKKHNLMLKKLYANKKTISNNQPKQNKYPTRNKTKYDYQEQNHDSKKHTMYKKMKEKQIKQQQQNKKPNQIDIVMGNSMMQMPFQVIPQPGQNPIMGVFPMMQNQNVQKKDGQTIMAGQKIPMTMGMGMQPFPGGFQSIQGMPGFQGIQGIPSFQGMQGMNGGIPISLGSNPGMIGMPQGLGFGGMPLNMINQPQQQNGQKKQSAKEGKQQQTQGQVPQKVVQMIPFGNGMQIPMMGGMNGPQMIQPGQMGQMGQMGIPINLAGLGGGLGGGQGISVMGPNGQVMMMQMMPQQLQQIAQSQQNQAQQSQSQNPTANSTSGQNSSTNNNPQNPSSSNPTQPQGSFQQIMLPNGIPISMMQGIQGMSGGIQGIPGGIQALQGNPAVQGLQGLQGIQGIQGVNPVMMPQGLNIGMYPQVGLINGGNNPNAPNPSAPQGQFIGLNQIPNLNGVNGVNGLPLNLMMGQNPLQQQNDKNKLGQVKPNNDNSVKKPESGKKEQKTENSPNANQTNNKPNALPSFLTSNNAFMQVNPNQNKQQDKNLTNQIPMTGMPAGLKMPMAPGQMPPGIMITPQMMQQLQQSQGGNPLQGISIMPPNGEQLNNMNPQQKMMLMQMMSGKTGGMGPLTMPPGGQMIQMPQMGQMGQVGQLGQIPQLGQISQMPQPIPQIGQMPQPIPQIGQLPQPIPQIGQIPQHLPQMGQMPQMVNFGGLNSLFSSPGQPNPNANNQQKKQQQKK